MNILIVYSTKHGATEKCAKIIAKKLTGKVELFNLKEKLKIDPSGYDVVIIGGSIYMGQIQKEVKTFCAQNIEQLKTKKIGLFTCCMLEGEKAEKQLADMFPKELLSIASSKECFGGEFNFSKMNFFEKLIIKKVSKVDKDTSNILENNINKMAIAFNNIL